MNLQNNPDLTIRSFLEVEHFIVHTWVFFSDTGSFPTVNKGRLLYGRYSIIYLFQLPGTRLFVNYFKCSNLFFYINLERWNLNVTRTKQSEMLLTNYTPLLFRNSTQTTY